MNGFDDVEYDFDGHAFVWVKPANGNTWDKFIWQTCKSTDTGWRPAMMIGYCDNVEQRWGQLDPRRIVVAGSQYHYRLEEFEFGGLLEFDEAPAPAPAM